MKEVSSKQMSLKIKNVFGNISKCGFGVHNWKLDDERNSLACISDAIVKDDIGKSLCCVVPIQVLKCILKIDIKVTDKGAVILFIFDDCLGSTV